MMQTDSQPSNPILLNYTQGVCLDCGQIHPARVERVGPEVFFTLECPAGSTRTRVSSNADLFLRLRERSAVVADDPPPHWDYRWFYVVNATETCDVRCPVCLNPCPEDGSGGFLPLAEVETVLRNVRHGGRRAVILSGGEPTMHPQITELVRRFAQHGFRVGMATNGKRIAAEPGLAKELRKAGLRAAWLQFDSVDPEVCLALRGRDCVAEKRAAADSLRAAGLRLAFNVTATKPSMETFDGLLKYALSLGPRMSVLNLQVAAPVGRYELGLDTLVDREHVLAAILECESLRGKITAEHIWPHPVFQPWQAAVHPDCAAVIVLLTDGDQIIPLDSLVDMEALYARLAANRMRSNLFTKNFVPLAYAWRLARKGQRLRLLSHLRGLMTGRGQRGVLVISVADLMPRQALDVERLRRCSTCELRREGVRPECLGCWDPAGAIRLPEVTPAFRERIDTI